MDYEQYTHFENFALEPISISLRRRFEDSYAEYNFELSRKHRSTLQEIRDNKLKYESKVPHLNLYINDLYAKIRELKRSLFQETEAGIIYLLEDIEVDDSRNNAMNCVRSLKRMVDSLYEIAEADFRLIAATITPAPVQKLKRNRTRSADKGSFELKNPDKNFNAIHARLTDENHRFIDPSTSVENLSRAFRGFNIAEKIVWYEANSLRYLIRELSGRDLIELTKEGIWRRTVLCFKPEHGEYKPQNFKDTKDPIAPVTRLLDEVIRLFST